MRLINTGSALNQLANKKYPNNFTARSDSKMCRSMVLLLPILLLAGCAAISEKEANESYGSGQIVYFEVNRLNVQNGNENGEIICREMGGEFCDSKYRASLNGHSGNIKVTLTKILKAFVLVPKEIQVKKYDIVKASFLDKSSTRTTPIVRFIEIADPTDCRWDGSGVVCKSGWDYRKDLPIAMR